MIQYIPIAFCFDNKYAQYATVATYSLIKSSKTPLKIYWVTDSDAIEYAKIYKEYLKKIDAEIILIDGGSNFEGWKEAYHISRGAYLRLLLPTLIKENKLIYLDCDTLILTDLSDLFKLDMGKFPIGGVPDKGAASYSKVPRSVTDVYINSGVLLLNLETLRQDDFLKKCEGIYSAHHVTITWADQCVINKYAEEKKLILESKWNRLIDSNNTSRIIWEKVVNVESANILHFVGSIKPWQQWCNPVMADFWWGFAKNLEMPNLSPVAINNITQALQLASVLDLNERFKDASKLKNDIINHLIQSLESRG